MTIFFHFQKSLIKPKLKLDQMDFYLNFLTFMCVKKE